MLTIAVEYLMGKVYAADYRDDAACEWPPHPARLFSAMVAAFNDGSGSDAEREALQWLEMQGPPDISAQSAGRFNSVTTFVPTNYGEQSKQPRFFPAQGLESPTVYFTWPAAEPTAEIRLTLNSLTERVTALGRACSLVRARVTDDSVTPNYIPDKSGDQTLRVIGEGRLEELESLYKRDIRPNVSGLARYRHVTKNDRPELASGCFREMLILKKTDGIGMPIEAALTLTDATRKALIALADDTDGTSEMLSGHGAHPHCAFAAIPFAGYPHATGNLMGVAVVLPRDINAASRRAVLKTCALLERINLAEVLGEWSVELANFDTQQRTLQAETWTKPAKSWATVTPVLLDRFPKKNLSVEDILRTACERAGLPSPASIDHSPYSALKGVPSVPEFRLLRRSEERPRWGVHVTLSFDQPVRGPILIGAGRYFGLGLMKQTAGAQP